MARQLRIQYPDATYHVFARGNERGTIYADDDDRLGFLHALTRTTERHEWYVLAYCLMGNHYHLIIRTPRGNLCDGMHHLGGAYAQAFNRRHRRSGHVFEGRYHSPLVESDSYLEALCRYVVRNPVRAGLCDRPEDWPWSSHLATLGAVPAPPFLKPELLLELFDRDPAIARARYGAFVGDALADAFWDPLRGRAVYGSNQFAAEKTTPLEPISKAIPRIQRQPNRPELADLLSVSTADDVLTAHRTYGYRISEIARFLRLHPTTVGRRLRAAENREAPSDRSDLHRRSNAGPDPIQKPSPL